MKTTRELLAGALAYWDSGEGNRSSYDGTFAEIRAYLSKEPPVSEQRFKKPTPKEVTDYARSIGFTLDGGQFCDFYESKGWKVGKTPMKDWRAAVRTWKRTSKPAADNKRNLMGY